MISIENTLQYLALTDSMVVAEFGCGSAHFTLALAKKLKRGRVYALDIQEQKLSTIKGRHIVCILCDLEKPNGSTLRASSLDIVLIPNLLFQVENKHAIIVEAMRVLKSGGQVLVLEETEKLKPEEVKTMALGLGLKIQHEFAAGDHHYSLLFIK